MQQERHHPGFLGQLRLLMWKNMLLHWRNKTMTFMEVILPFSGGLLLMFLRGMVELKHIQTPTTFPGKNLSSDAVGIIILANPGESFVLYAPNTTLVKSLITEVSKLSREDQNEAIFLGFPSESDLEKYFLEDENRSELIALALVFDVDDSATAWPAEVTYKIRPNAAEEKWNTELIFKFGLDLQPREEFSDIYYEQGFLYLQKAVDLAIIKTWQPSPSLSTPEWFINRIPFPPYIIDSMNVLVRTVFHFVAMLSLMMSAVIMTKCVVYDKESQLKESMKLMGMTEEALWMSWFLQFFCSLMLASIGNTILFCFTIRGQRPVLPSSNPSLIFVFFLCYSMTVIGFAFFSSALVNKANTGSLVAGLTFFATHLPYLLMSEETYIHLTHGKKMAVCLLFNTAMAFGVRLISFHEGTGNGAKWSNIASPATFGDSLTLYHILIMLIIDAVILFFLAWYIDKVHPGEYGIPQPWYFLCQRSYWCGDHKQKSSFLEEEEDANYDSARFESEPFGLPVGIKMLHLKKVFDNGKVAVKDSTLSIFEDQITVLLGHNGAGKTTTMSMLTGFTTPTSGTAYVNGYDIRKDMVSVRGSLGLCPQHNILLPNLTVEEHLKFFCLVKGCNKSHVPSLVRVVAEDVGLLNKLKADASTLSGGQKRKLCVAIALAGGSKVVILDEPTSGMDPAARRQTWETLQRNRAGRTILLSTHFMDEADILGDRIAIMAEGVVRCCGTPLFLKKIYGAGYHLVIVKDRGCDVHAVTAAIEKIIETAELEGAAGAELSYLLPADEASKLPELFRMIESDSKALGISSFGVTATTMEEVFLKVGASALPEQEAENSVTRVDASALPDQETDSSVDPDFLDNQTRDVPRTPDWGSERRGSTKYEAFTTLSSSYERLTFPKLQLSRIYGMFVKKAINTARNWKITFVQIALPVVFTILPVMNSRAQTLIPHEPPLRLDLGMFTETVTGYSTGFPTSSEATTKMGNAYRTLFSGPNSIREVDPARFSNMDDYFLSLSTDLGPSNFAPTVLIGSEFNVAYSEINGSKVSNVGNVTAWYSGQPLHSQPVALAYVMNAYARAVTGDNSHTITTINHPLPASESKIRTSGMMDALFKGISLIFGMLFGLAFLTASFSYFLIGERQTGAKHLQIVSGVDPLSFWLSTFAWDFIAVFITILLILAVFAGFKEETLTHGNNMAVAFLVFCCYGVAVLPYVYLLQFYFIVPASGLVALVLLTFITGLFTLILSFALSIPGMVKNPETIENVMRIMFPHFCVSNSLLGIYMNKNSKDYCKDIKEEQCQTMKENELRHPCCKEICGKECLLQADSLLSMTFPGVGMNIVCLLSQALLFFFIVLAVDFNVLQKILYMLKSLGGNCCVGKERFNAANDEDSDVREERQRVMSGGAAGDTLVLDDVFKQFGSSVAVDHVFLGVPKQECFGLLGQNGAGKTTIFKILTGDVMVSRGNAFVLRHSIKTDIKGVQANMGYCPQFDALIEQMTGRETLYMYARLRGVPGDVIPSLVSSLLSALMLSEYADHRSGNYSGGNKRKLSAAIALIGNPAIILLDEPTSGVDPAARRQLWTVLSKVRASGHTIILTSHSMEECEALCTRLAIMVIGQYKCLGSVQHLKNKFSQGFTVKVKMASTTDGAHVSIWPLVEFILDTFPGTQKIEDQEGYVTFQLTDPNILLSRLFVVMDQCKEEFSMEDFSVSQTSLEEIFLQFTRVQPMPRTTYINPVANCFCPAAC